MSNPTIVFVTTCKGRTEHLSQTLPRNLRDNADYPNCHFVVLDYGDAGELRAYLAANHLRDMQIGRLSVFRHEAPGAFHVSHAKNMAARCGMLPMGIGVYGAPRILVTLDADNFTGVSFARWIADQFESDDSKFPGAFLCPNFPLIQSLPHGPLRPMRGFAGRLAIRAHDFLKLGGYDESYDTWRGEDIDMIARSQRLGYSMRHIDNRYLGVIPHNAEVRFAEYPHAKQYENKGEVQAINARSNTLVNFGKIGCGTVYRNFGVHPIQLGPVPTRVFGIGLHKTGTTSLDAAFKILGLSSFHWGVGESPRIWHEMQALGKSPTMERWYAFSDLPFPLLYKQLDKAYPGSKFILTVRSEDKWIKSVERLWDPKYNPTRWVWDKWPFTNTIHTALYGQATFDREVFLARYRRHNAEVRHYFRGSADLLVMNAGDGWSRIADFLGMPTPRVPYPLHNQTMPGEQSIFSPQEVARIDEFRAAEVSKEYRAWVKTDPSYCFEKGEKMGGNINNWWRFLKIVNPETQACTFPYLQPFAPKPTQTNTVTGFVTYLDPEDWAVEGCAEYVAGVLGGTVTEVAPEWDPQPVGPYVFGQKHYWVALPNGTTIDPADLVQKFIHIANRVELEEAMPSFLGITPGG